MTEEQWDKRIRSLENKVSKRKMRLFACACCRLLWLSLTDRRSRKAVEASERCADGIIKTKELVAFRKRALDAKKNAWLGDAEQAAAAVAAGRCKPSYVANLVRIAAIGLPPDITSRFQELVLRDIIGSALDKRSRRATMHPAWRSSTVLALAHSIYDERAFDRMPILADALEEAGCTNEEILSHCRRSPFSSGNLRWGDDDHFRGCWVVDLLLGKE